MVTIDTTHDDALREVPFARETIYDGHILHVEKWRVTCPNGREAPREIVVHKGAAAVVPVFDNGDTLLVRQHRVAVDRVTRRASWTARAKIRWIARRASCARKPAFPPSA